jgi:Ni,Fe-hydrogenase I large subunit
MTTADLAGELAVAVGVRGGIVRQVRIDSTRPQLADRLLAGRPAAEAVALVPRLFAICGRSQHVAAELALIAARGAAGTADSAQVRRIESEMAHEYLWRVLIDWNRAEGLEPDDAALAAARSALAHDDRDLLRVVVERDVLGADARQWHECEQVSGFEHWIGRGDTAAARFLRRVQRDGPGHGASPVPLLPRFDDEETASRIVARLDGDAGFERSPTFDGAPAETGAIARLARQPLPAALADAYGRSTLVRFAARLAELARIACADDPPAPLAGCVNLGRGRGLGWAETARGLLLHQIDLDGETVGRYRIVAPTEWNFHPQGALAAATLGGREAAAADLRRRTEWLIQSLDPCVAYRLEIDDA